MPSQSISANSPTLFFDIGEKQKAEFQLDELKKQLKTHSLQFYNKLAKKQKRYNAFALTDLLEIAYGPQWQQTEFSHMAFVAIDGYQAISSIEKLKETGAFLAFEDLDVTTGWEPIGFKNSNPGPFFLVWHKEHQTTENAYPWPWQLSRFKLVKFSEQYPAVYPAGFKKDTAIYEGFKIFRDRCMRCHAINKEGGIIGPDLNAPQNITTYRPKEQLIDMIKQMSKYRHSHMPDHRDLSALQLEHLYQYLKSRDSIR